MPQDDDANFGIGALAPDIVIVEKRGAANLILTSAHLLDEADCVGLDQEGAAASLQKRRPEFLGS